jgi:hypothetical protein
MNEKCLLCDGDVSRGRWCTSTCASCHEHLKNALRSRRNLWHEKALGENAAAFQYCIICGPRSRTGAFEVGCIDAQRSVCQWCVREEAAQVQKGCADSSLTWTPTNCSDWAHFLRKYDPAVGVKPAKKKARTTFLPPNPQTPTPNPQPPTPNPQPSTPNLQPPHPPSPQPPNPQTPNPQTPTPNHQPPTHNPHPPTPSPQPPTPNPQPPTKLKLKQFGNTRGLSRWCGG